MVVVGLFLVKNRHRAVVVTEVLRTNRRLVNQARAGDCGHLHIPKGPVAREPIIRRLAQVTIYAAELAGEEIANRTRFFED